MPALLRYGRGRANDALVGRKFAGDEGGIAQLAGTDRDIKVVADDIDEVVGDMEVELDFGIARNELRQTRRKVETGERRWRSHSEQAGWLVVARADELLGFRGPVQDIYSMLEIAFAGFGQRKLPGRSLEEPRAEALFEKSNPFGDDSG